MSYSENLTVSLENSRNCLRRIARNDDTEFSNQSVFNVIEKFVKSVNIMDETILIPRRLMDLKVGDELDPSSKDVKSRSPINELLRSADLFQLYNMLHEIKGDLVWGRDVKRQGHIRRPSTASVTSSSSMTSDTESDGGIETDSGIEEGQENSFGDRTDHIASDFRRHLVGLTASLRQMTEAAHYLTNRYQHDIGGP